ncbi:hypothetical protein [Actinoallomurus sp. CA-150999]
MDVTPDVEAGQADGGHEEQEAGVQFFGPMETLPEQPVLLWHGRQ